MANSSGALSCASEPVEANQTNAPCVCVLWLQSPTGAYSAINDRTSEWPVHVFGSCFFQHVWNKRATYPPPTLPVSPSDQTVRLHFQHRPALLPLRAVRRPRAQRLAQRAAQRRRGGRTELRFGAEEVRLGGT